MSPELVGILGIVILLLVLFFLGMPVGFAMAVVGFCGFAHLISFKAAFAMVGTDIWGTFSKLARAMSTETFGMSLIS